MLNWLEQFNIFCLLQSNTVQNKYSNYNTLVGVESIETITCNTNCLQQLNLIQQKKDWFFGHLSYNLKNEVEQLSTTKEDFIGFNHITFFRPKIVLLLNHNILTIESIEEEPNGIFQAIEAKSITEFEKTKITVTARVSKEEYINAINAIKQHIQRGDCYELNYCMEFYNSNANIHPTPIFQQLEKISPNPFSAYYKLNDKYLICASPERFLKKENNQIISQPIKGTIKRDLQNEENDYSLKTKLQLNPKEKSENVMVVDLVRNDLSKICEAKSVLVEDFLNVYTFPQVHHLISTVIGTLKNNITLSQIIEATFPMGSMTGAPKKRVMELIEQYEKSNRGIFSGSVGYIKPNGDFDFNVVIRSIMYNAVTKYLSYQVGSGITIYCNAESEYEECLLKAKAIEAVLNNED